MIQKPIFALIRFYQLAISPHLGRWCRFEPSCSEYTRLAIQQHGTLRGILLGIHRLCRCNPFCKGGHDPVPESPHLMKTACCGGYSHGR